MESKTIFEWAEMFQEQIQSGASQSYIIQMLEEYGNQALRIQIHDVCSCDKWHDRMEESNNNCSTCNKPIN